MSLEVRHMQRQVTERATDGQRHHLFVAHRDRILVVGVAAKDSSAPSPESTTVTSLRAISAKNHSGTEDRLDCGSSM